MPRIFPPKLQNYRLFAYGVKANDVSCVQRNPVTDDAPDRIYPGQT